MAVEHERKGLKLVSVWAKKTIVDAWRKHCKNKDVKQRPELERAFKEQMKKG